MNFQDGEIVKLLVSMIAIICLTALEIVALLTGQNGALFLPIVGVIGGIAGYNIKPVIDKIRN